MVRETFNEKDNLARQVVIYYSPKLTSSPPVAIVTEGPSAAPQAAAAPQKSAAGGDRAWRKEDKKTAPKTAASKAKAKKKKTKKKPSNSALPVRLDGPTLADALPRLLGVAIVSLTGALALAYIAYALVQALPSVDIVLGKTML